MTKNIDKTELSTGEVIAISAAALVLNLAEITLIGMFLAWMAMILSETFGSSEHTQLHAAVLVGVSILFISGSMVAVSTRNVPFLCKQFGAVSSKAAKISANVGAIVWAFAALGISMSANGDLSIGVIPIYIGLFGGMAVQLLMGYKKAASTDLQSVETLAAPSFIQSENDLDSNGPKPIQNQDSALSADTITLPEADTTITLPVSDTVSFTNATIKLTHHQQDEL